MLQAQTFPFRTYSIEHGLSESVVNDIIQDTEGYIWIATGFGLNRFDGVNFDVYLEDHGLNNSNIFSVYQSKNETLWIGSENGINYMIQDSIYTDSSFIALSNSVVISIFEDSEGGMWFGTDGDGVWHFLEGTDPILYTTANGFRNSQVRAIKETWDGDIWFATRDGVTVLSNGNISTYTTDDGLPENRTRDILIDNDSTIWIATRNGLSKFTGQGFENYGIEHGIRDPKIHTLSLARDGSIWAGTEGGVSQLKEERFRNFSTQEGLTNNIVYSSLVDREGNIWFGTFAGGMSLFLGAYLENYSTDNGLPNNLVTSFAELENGEIWISTYGGGLISYTDGELRYLYSQHGLLDNRVYHLSGASENRMWIGMRDGLGFYQNGEINSLSAEEFPFRKVRHVNESEDGTLWVSTYDEGMIHFTGDGFTQYTTEDGLTNNTVVSSVFDDEGSLWMATYGGVAKMEGDSIRVFSLQDGVPNNRVMSIIKDHSGTIWVSTYDGVAWFDGVQFVDIREEDGLPGRVCFFIGQDQDGIYWVGTNKGVARLDIQKFYNSDRTISEQGIQIINREHGLIGDETNLGAYFEDSSGDLWFGTIDGLSKFTSSEYRGNDAAPIVQFQGFSASGRDYEDVQSIELEHDRNYIQINFSAINFTSPNQIIYEYRMRGIDPVWQRTTDRFVKYPSLPPGDYKFRVRAINSSGIWSEEQAIMEFVITPPYWQTWWFLSAVVLSVVGIIYLFYRNYKTMKMVDIERMRVRIASDLHDDVGASLTEIALQSDFLQASNVDSSFKQSLEQIGKQCRKIVTSLDDIVWSIDARNDTLGDLTDRMQDYVLKVLEPQNFSVEYDFEELKMENKLPVSVKENLYLIFKEAINNIAKYSNGNRVQLIMQNSNGEFFFRIRDNGKVSKGPRKSGQGLRNMEMRAQRIGGILDIKVKDGFVITLKGKLNLN